MHLITIISLIILAHFKIFFLIRWLERGNVIFGLCVVFVSQSPNSSCKGIKTLNRSNRPFPLFDVGRFQKCGFNQSIPAPYVRAALHED